MPIELEPSPEAATTAAPPPRGGSSSRGLWLRVGLAVALLAGSGAARAWQSRRVDEALRDGRVAPFSLKLLPRQIGPWSGEDTKLDPEIAKMTGGTEIVTRAYRHQTTGQRIELIFLFGPSTLVYGHSPEICYPSAGFALVKGPDGKTVTDAKKAASWPFRTAVYMKGEGGMPQRQEVYWSWRYAGGWNPDPISYKGIERIPGMFKIHIDRGIKSKEEIALLDVGNPCQAFLGALMPEIDRLIAASSKEKGKGKKADRPAAAKGAPAAR